MYNFTVDGFTIIDNCIPIELLDSIYSKFDSLYPVRASSSNKTYAEGNQIKELNDISVWWSQLVIDWVEVQEINHIVHSKVLNYLPNSELYTSDIVVINGKSTWINPHVDTPYRFKEYNFDKRLLGIQCIIPLFDLDKNNGSTGLVPKSHTKNFDINLCYKGQFNYWFSERVVQPEIKKGSVLMYNCRVLHSSMPNNVDTVRPALLCNYVDSSIVDGIKKLDSVWSSNA